MKTRSLPFLALAAIAAITLAFNAGPALALVENQSFGIFGVAPVTTQPAGAGQGAFTDSTTGTAGLTLAAGTGVDTIAIPIQLASMTTAAADLITAYTPGYRFKVLSVSFATTTLGTGSGASQVLNLAISGTAVTGGVTTLTLATTTPLGNLIAGTSVTAANVGASTDTLSLKVAASGTVFTAGSGALLIKLQNMDTADAAASLARQGNAWRTLLVALGLAKGSA